MARFKLLAGRHSQKEPKNGADGQPLKDKDGNVMLFPVIYTTGQVFESRHDLVGLFNRPNAVKFERVDDDPQAQRQRQYDPKRPGPAHPDRGQDVSGSGEERQQSVTSSRQESPENPENPTGGVPGGVKHGPALAPADRIQAKAGKRLDELSVKDLQTHAEAEGVDLRGVPAKRDDIIKVLRAAR